MGHGDVEGSESLEDGNPARAEDPAIACVFSLEIRELDGEGLDVSCVVVEGGGIDASDVVGD